MKTWLAAAALFSFLGCAGVSIQSVRIYAIEPLEAADLIRNRSCFVLDASSPEEFEIGHLPNAVNIPHGEFWARGRYLPDDKDRVIIVYDREGRRSLNMATLLRDEGYWEVREVKGGFDAWVRAGLPVSRSSRMILLGSK